MQRRGGITVLVISPVEVASRAGRRSGWPKDGEETKQDCLFSEKQRLVVESGCAAGDKEEWPSLFRLSRHSSECEGAMKKGRMRGS